MFNQEPNQRHEKIAYIFKIVQKMFSQEISMNDMNF